MCFPRILFKTNKSEVVKLIRLHTSDAILPALARIHNVKQTESPGGVIVRRYGDRSPPHRVRSQALQVHPHGFIRFGVGALVQEAFANACAHSTRQRWLWQGRVRLHISTRRRKVQLVSFCEQGRSYPRRLRPPWGCFVWGRNWTWLREALSITHMDAIKRRVLRINVDKDLRKLEAGSSTSFDCAARTRSATVTQLCESLLNVGCRNVRKVLESKFDEGCRHAFVGAESKQKRCSRCGACPWYHHE